MLALHEVWILGLDYWYASFNTISIINAVMLCLFLVLAVTSSLRVHTIGASLTWAGYIVALVMRALETTGAQ